MTSSTSAHPGPDSAPGAGGTGDDEPDVSTGVVDPDADLENLDGTSGDADADDAEDEVPDGHA